MQASSGAGWKRSAPAYDLRVPARMTSFCDISAALLGVIQTFGGVSLSLHVECRAGESRRVCSKTILDEAMTRSVKMGCGDLQPPRIDPTTSTDLSWEHGLENRCTGNRTVGSNPTLSDLCRC